MISKRMRPLVENNSAIRVMFEEGKRLASLYGVENVFDFSLGNPNVPAPASVNQAIADVLREEDSVTVHGYMSNAGFSDTRKAVADSLNRRFGTDFGEENIVMISGAAGGLNAVLKAILDPGDEVATFAPYFMEYKNYVANYDARLVEVPSNSETFLPDLTALGNAITEKTRAVLINNPNNPTGVIYPEESIIRLAELLSAKEKVYGHAIYLISDEPYRELAYDGAKVPFVTRYYSDAIVVYSFSKSLSLPGERIGYVAVPDKAEDAKDLTQAIVIANRVLGHVNAPSLMQRMLVRCIDEETDLNAYDRNRKLLYEGLTECGFQCVKPEGAFYLFVKSPTTDEIQFCESAKKYNILFVPGGSFACPGYVRIAYCVSYDTIKNSLPAFRKLAEEYHLK
ncbi:MAG: pyridoxal phosphate-dependent aminotransferase [Lachnospiraceae bacterium]|nr:pyridoxal phosphate-dependent aminotransferase [Lachnospiraceae bacterium]